jgi:hypothetical protein
MLKVLLSCEYATKKKKKKKKKKKNLFYLPTCASVNKNEISVKIRALGVEYW